MRLYKLEVATYEAKAYPVVIHAFLGETKEEAERYYKAHLTTDKFFADCGLKGKFADFECRNRVVFSGWVSFAQTP